MKVMNMRLVRAAARLDPLWKALSRLPLGGRGLVDQGPKSILVIDLHLVGDMVMLLPLLAALRRRYPTARLTLLAGPWSDFVIRSSGLVDEVIPFVASWVKPRRRLQALFDYARIVRLLRRRSWDIGLDVRGDVRQILMLFLAGCRRRIGFDFTGGADLLTEVVPDDGQLSHILDHHQRIARQMDAWDGQHFIPRIALSDAERRDAEAIEPFIGFHFGASLALRRLPPQEAAKLVRLHGASGTRLVLFSSPDIESYVQEIIALLPESVARGLETWRGSLREFVVTLSRAQRVFVMDSGPAHIAAALGCETVIFFGPNLPRYTAPRGERVLLLEHPGMLCRPCDQHHCVNATRQACLLGLVEQWEQVAAPMRAR